MVGVHTGHRSKSSGSAVAARLDDRHGRQRVAEVPAAGDGNNILQQRFLYLNFGQFLQCAMRQGDAADKENLYRSNVS